MLLLGGLIVALAALIGGAAGFGASLIATPFLLTIGLPLPFVVTVNLTMTLVTRLVVVRRLRRDLAVRTVALLVGGSVPGILFGTQLLTIVSAPTIKRATGIVVMVATVLLVLVANGPPPRPLPGAAALAGLFGGVLGATTSLNGMPAVLFLARDRVSPRRFLANLAAYFVCANTLTLILLAARGELARQALFPIALLWLPGALFGNAFGVTLADRLPAKTFRAFTYTLAFIAGLLTTLTA